MYFARKGASHPESLSAGRTLWMLWGDFFWLCCGYKLAGQRLCIFSCDTIVTSPVTISLPFSCSCKQGLIMTKEILPAAKWNWMLFDFLHTGRCWALPVLFGVSDFSTPSNSWCLECPFCLSLTCKKLLLLLSQSIFEDSFVYESLGDLRGHIFLQMSLICEATFISKKNVFPGLFWVNSVWAAAFSHGYTNTLLPHTPSSKTRESIDLSLSKIHGKYKMFCVFSEGMGMEGMYEWRNCNSRTLCLWLQLNQSPESLLQTNFFL